MLLWQQYNLETGRINFEMTIWPVKKHSDGRVDRASAFELVDSEFDSERSQTNDWKIGIHSYQTFSIAGIVLSKPSSSLDVPFGKTLNGIPWL